MKYVVLALILAAIVAASVTATYACKRVVCTTFGNQTVCQCY